MKDEILYVDDELWAMEGVIESLKTDYEVTTARNADQALDLLESKGDDFSLIVLDVRMPQGERIKDKNKGRTMGIALAHKLKEDGNKIPIIAHTVVHDEAIHEQLLDEGVKQIVMKTEPPSKLKAEIRKILQLN